MATSRHGNLHSRRWQYGDLRRASR